MGRVIHIFSDLKSLPIGSVVLDNMGDAWQNSDYHDDWVCAGYGLSEEGSDIELYFPVTVIYEGENFEN